MKHSFGVTRRSAALLIALMMALSLMMPAIALAEGAPDVPDWYTGELPYAPPNGDTLGSFIVIDFEGTVTLVGYTGAGGHVVIPEGIEKIGFIAEAPDWSYAWTLAFDPFDTGSPLADNLLDIFATYPPAEDYTTYVSSGYGGSNPLTAVTLPSTLIEIEQSAFADSALEDLELPDSLKYIRAEAFYGTNLSGKFIVPATVEYIGGSAFARTDITSVEFPSGSTPLKVGDAAFNHCASLESVTGDREITWDRPSFDGSALLRTIDLPNWSGTIGYDTFGHSAEMTEITIPEGITAIQGSNSHGLFSGTGIREVIFPYGFVYFGGYDILGGTSGSTYRDSLLEYAAILSTNVTTDNNPDYGLGLTQISTAFRQRSREAAGDYPGEEKFQAVYVYPGTTTADSVLINDYLGTSKVRYLTRNVRATVQDPDNVGFAFSDEITAAWDDCKTGEDIFPSFEPTVLDAWERVKIEKDSSLPDFGAFTLNGAPYARADAGKTAILEGDKLHFIPAGMTLPWFEQNGTKKQAIQIVPDTDNMLTLMSEAGPIANIPLYYADTTTWLPTTQLGTTNAQGQFTLNLAEGTYVITPRDPDNNVAFNFLTVTSERMARLGGLTGTGTPAFSGEAILGTDFMAGTLTKAGGLTPVTSFDPYNTEYDFYANRDTTSVTFTVSPQIPEIAEDMTLTVSGTDMNNASPDGGKWTVTVPLSDTVTPVTFTVYDTVSETSAEYTVNIKRAVTWNGTDKTIIITSAQDMALLSNAVGQGTTFEDITLKLTEDIHLPADWIPMGGGTATGPLVHPFSGIFDGDGHTITFAPGSKPLLKYSRGATVQNLKIKGDDIDGNGLLDVYFVDYGPTGAYGPNAITTINVNNFTILSGTNIRGSGITGGYASGINHINVMNSTVEAGVKIGWNAENNISSGLSKIGSFGGDFNGTVTNSVSYADVYGVSNVGGLVGSKGQSMGPCAISNSSFHGTIHATGSFVGGIIGNGYVRSDAPNSPCVSIENSYVTGTINGANCVGGIFGGEGGVKQCWANGIGYIRNNHFVGTINSGGAYVGGIIGYMTSLNKNNVITNNYYLQDTATIGIGGVGRIETAHSSPADVAGVEYSTKGYPRADDPLGADAEELTKSVTPDQMKNDVAGWLNDGEGSLGNWLNGSNYPIHDPNFVTVSSITLSGNYKTQYRVNDPADYTGLVIDVVFSDGNTGKLDWNSDGVSFTGFDSSAPGERTITVSYSGARVTYTVYVLPRVADPIPPGAETVEVSFRLVGSTLTDKIEGSEERMDVDLTDGCYNGAEYVTWIATRTYTLEKGSSMYELFMMALSDAELTSVGAQTNYVRTIYAPAAYGGYGLSEFTNGPRSGWMYTVDGSHPNLGILEYTLTSDCDVVWHYVNDYAYEVHDWDELGGEDFPSMGDGTYWSKWLEAADETLASNAADVGEAKSTVKSLDYTLSMATANTEAAVKPWIEAQIAKLDLNGVAADVVMNSFTPAVAATEANPGGTEGGFTFTVYLSKGEGEALASDSLQISGRVTVPLPGDIEEARKVDDLIAKIGDPVTLADKAKIEEARAAYNALTDPQKNLVTKLEDLQAAEAKLGDLQEAKAVEDKIAAIGTVTLESKAKIEAARAAYNALPTAQADLVSNYQTLAAAEAAYAALLAEKENAEEAKKVDDLIAEIGDPVTLADKAKIAEARAAYNALTDPQKDLVTKLDQLKAAEAALAQLLKPVQDAEKLIDELPAAISGSEADQLALLKASTAFDKLSDQEKAELDQKLQEKLLSLREEAAKINHTSNGVQIGNLPWNIVLIATPISKGEDDYEAMRKEAENKLGAGRSILGMYDLSLQELTESGLVEYRLDGKTAQITITVPDLTKYKNIKIIHQLADGSYEYIEPTKIEGNKVTFIVESLSKYAVVGQLIEAEPEPTPLPGDENKNGKPSAGGKQTGTGSATGDHSAVPTTAALLLIALCACGYLYSRKRREENGL